MQPPMSVPPNHVAARADWPPRNRSRIGQEKTTPNGEWLKLGRAFAATSGKLKLPLLTARALHVTHSWEHELADCGAFAQLSVALGRSCLSASHPLILSDSSPSRYFELSVPNPLCSNPFTLFQIGCDVTGNGMASWLSLGLIVCR